MLDRRGFDPWNRNRFRGRRTRPGRSTEEVARRRTAQDPAVAVLNPLGQVGTFAPGDLEPLFDAPLRAGRNRRPVAVTGEDRKGDEDDRTKNSTDEMHVTYPKDTCSFGSMPRQ